MNKRANIYLNIYSIVFFLLAISLLGLSITLGELTFTIPSIVRYSTFFLGMISTILFISSELFLFILLTNKYKIIDVIYIILIGIIAVYFNSLIPFLGFVIIILIPITISITRISYVEKIYIPKEFNRYCKMFNIKIKDFPKKRNTKSTSIKKTNKETIKIEDNPETISPKRKSKKKSVKSYT